METEGKKGYVSLEEHSALLSTIEGREDQRLVHHQRSISDMPCPEVMNIDKQYTYIDFFPYGEK